MGGDTGDALAVHNPDADGPKFEYSLRVLWPDDNGLTLTSGRCGPQGMAKILRDELNAVERCYPQVGGDTGDAPARTDLDEAKAVVADAMRRTPRADWKAWVLILDTLAERDAENARLRAVEAAATDVARSASLDRYLSSPKVSWPALDHLARALAAAPAPTEDDRPTDAEFDQFRADAASCRGPDPMASGRPHSEDDDA